MGRLLADVKTLAHEWSREILSYMPKLWRPACGTHRRIATIGTAIAMCLAVPLAFLAAHNTTPHKSVRAVMLFHHCGNSVGEFR